MKLDETTIRELLAFDDPQGVLSFYAGHTPAQAAERRPTSPIEIRNQLKTLRSRLADGDPDLARAVESRIDSLDGSLDVLMDPKAHGRGRVLFVGVQSGEQRSLSLQIPFLERVIHRETPYVRPLVAALDEGRSAGILVVTKAGTRLLEWSLGEGSVLETREFEVFDEQVSAERSGPAAGSPSGAQQNYVDRDGFEERIDVNRTRFLREVADDLAARVKTEGWDRLVVSAPPKLRETVKDTLSAVETRVIVAEQAWEDAPAHEIADAAWDLLRSVHRDREQELVSLAIDRALGGQAGAVGLRQVCEALNEGRVAQLLYDVELQLEGFVSAEGTVHPRVEGVMAESDVEWRAEQWFVERLLEKAITTSASVVTVGSDAATLLEDHEGVAALLRW